MMRFCKPLMVAATGGAVALSLLGARALAQGKDPLKDKPDATVNLATKEGVDLVKGGWRYRDVEIKTVDAAKKVYNYEPHANQAAKPDYDDSSWELLDPTTLNKPRGGGQLSFAWYRTKVTIPEKVGDFDTRGSTVVFETTVDDYGEIWVNGNLPRSLRQAGGSIVAGFNAPNRLVVGKDVQPGQTITLAVFGMNSPISATPGNFIFLRTDPAFGTKLDFYKK